MMEVKKTQAIKVLNQLIKELESIPINNMTIYKEKFERWKERAVQNIKENISDSEARSFEGKNFFSRYALSSRYSENDLLFDKTSFYIDILKSLKDEINLHPESFYDVSKMPVSKRWEHCFEMMHPKISEFSKKLFIDGHISDAVFASFKEVNVLVKHSYKSATGKELDGRDLMMKAFNEENAIVKLAKMENVTDKNIQEGYKYIFAGAMTAIRNPKAHDHIKIDEKRGIHLLFLASLLFYKLEETI